MPDAVVGRGRELEAAAQLLRGLGGGAAALVLEGEPGIGKTTVWSEAVERARDCVVLSARPTKADASLAFASLPDLLERVADGVIADLPGPQRTAIAAALLREGPGPEGLDQRAVGAATLSVVRTLVRTSAVLVAIDDLQWLDRPSARALDFTLRRLEGLPVGVLACVRLDGAHKLPLDVGTAFPAERCVRLRLEPLSLAALQGILKRSLGRTFPRRTLVRIESVAAGNPLFALELARVLPADASAATALPMPRSLLGLVEDRIGGLPQRSKRQLLITAAAGSPTIGLVLSATTAERADALAALYRAVEAGVITVHGSRVRFSHPLFAEGVYSSASVRERRDAHRRLAGLVDGIEERARHLALAASGDPDADLANILDAGAEHARRRGAPDVAAELADRARLLTPAVDIQRGRWRTIRAADCLYHAGELQGAREMVETMLREVPGGRLRAVALALLGDIHAQEDSVLEAHRLFEEALEHVGEDLETRSALELRLTYGLNVQGDFPAIASHAQRAVTLAERVDNAGLLAEALAVGAIADCLLGRGIDEEKIERALALENPNRETPVAFRPSLIAGCVAIYAGKLEGGERILSQLRQRLVDRGEESDVAFVCCQLVWAACWQGRLRAAADFAREGLEIATTIGAESTRCLALAFAAVRAAYAGEPQLTRRMAAQCRELAPRTSNQVAVLWAGWAEAVLALSLDDPQAADAALGPLATPFEHEVPDPARPFFLPDEIEALVALGRLDPAERLLDNFEASAQRLQRRWALMRSARCRALLLAARGDLDPASDVASDALSLCEGLQLRIEVARTLLVTGQLERRRRKKRAAAEYLRQAAREFEEMGARLWAERARAELHRVGLRPSAPDELTASERRVAELSASGLKNREVAAQLFVSPKTVEATLARVYRKLEIHSRAELGARLGREQRTTAQM